MKIFFLIFPIVVSLSSAVACDEVANQVITDHLRDQNRYVDINYITAEGLHQKGEILIVPELVKNNEYTVVSAEAWVYFLGGEENVGYFIEAYELEPESCKIIHDEIVYSE
ncbi:MAG: hypothetical protein KDD33_04630 [Bdellovibrionales bacterium]|nr:hypothetical protein [Bdellovibrionales bacterium]